MSLFPQRSIVLYKRVDTLRRTTSNLLHRIAQRCLQILRSLDLDVSKEVGIVLRNSCLHQVLDARFLVQLDVLDRATKDLRELCSDLHILLVTP
jgi:hypothetical protein